MPITHDETGFSPGSYGISNARVPGEPVFVSNGTNSITIDINESGNDAVCQYTLRIKVDPELDGTYTTPGYVQADGTIGAGEIWRTAAAWGNVTITGLTDFYAYTFAAKAKNEAGTETVYGDESEIMNTLPLIDEGLESDALERTVTGGNVIVDESYGVVITSTNTVTEVTTETQYYGVITFAYKLKSYDLDTASVDVEYSEDSGSNWATATSSGSDGKTGLITSVAGTAHVFGWDSYTDAGTSEYQRDVMIRIRAKDAEGDASDWVVTEEFIVYNRPAKPTVTNADNREYDEDTTPVFEAVMPSLRGGGPGWPVIRIFETDGTTLVNGYPKKGVEDVNGWQYQTDASTWVSLTPAGINGTYCNGILKMRYTVQTALAVGDYLITMTMSELRDWS